MIKVKELLIEIIGMLFSVIDYFVRFLGYGIIIWVLINYYKGELVIKHIDDNKSDITIKILTIGPEYTGDTNGSSDAIRY